MTVNASQAEATSKSDVQETVKSLLTIPCDLRELINDLEEGDITRNDLVDYLTALANSLELNTKWLRLLLPAASDNMCGSN